MPIDRGKLAIAGLVSAILLAWLWRTADFAFPDVTAIDFVALGTLGLAIVSILACRSLTFRSMAPPDLQHGILRWLQLAARHQAVFSLFPGGIGDIGFPYLARRIAGIEMPVALRIIAQVRLRDAVFIALLGLGGLASAGRSVEYAPLAIVIAMALLWFIEDIVGHALRLLTLFLPGNRLTLLLSKVAVGQPPTIRERLLRTVLTASVWGSTLVAVIAAFATIGVPIGLGQAMLVVAAVNVAGAIAVSFAGLGVSEAGAAAALVISGYPLDRASAIALLVRPLLLVVIVATSVALDLVTSGLRKRQVRGDARPKSETAESRTEP